MSIPDNSVIRFFFGREPWKVTAQQKGAQAAPAVAARGRRVLSTQRAVRFYHKPEYKKAEKTLVELLSYASSDLTEIPVSEPLVICLSLVWPYRKSDLRTERGRAGLLIPHDKRPDLDNLSKLYLDALVKAGVLSDDSIAWRVILEKFYGPREAVGIQYQIKHITNYDITIL